MGMALLEGILIAGGKNSDKSIAPVAFGEGLLGDGEVNAIRLASMKFFGSLVGFVVEGITEG
jgi:hypothetical protein